MLALLLVLGAAQSSATSVPASSAVSDVYFAAAMFTTQGAEVEAVACSSSGPIPTWLTGTLVRNGVGAFDASLVGGNRSYMHLFDAMAKLHSWAIQGHASSPTVAFSTRFLNSTFAAKCRNMSDLEPTVLFLPTVPPYTTAQRAAALSTSSDNVNVNVVPLGPGLALATTDTSRSVGINTITLESLGDTQVCVS